MFIFFRYTFYAALLVGALAFNHNYQSGRPQILSRTLPKEKASGQLELVSKPYKIDRKYQSMEGPAGLQSDFQLGPSLGDSEVFYLNSVESEVVDARSLQTVSPEFFCHANLTLSERSTKPEKHNATFDPPLHADWRLFTLVPGRMSLKLPEGFGVPIRNGTHLDYLTMTLNQNDGVPETDVRIRTKIGFSDASKPVTPVFRRSVYVYMAHKEGQETTVDVDPAVHSGQKCGEMCSLNQRAKVASIAKDMAALNHPGASCCVENASSGGVMLQFGSNNTIHWMVPPGHHCYTTDVTPQMQLPADTTAHYITGHLHPTGVKLTLVDKDTGKAVADIASRDMTDKFGVADMTQISSLEGIPLKKTAHYELVAEYDNKTGHAIDAMAIMYLYLAEPQPKSSRVAAN
ncbi:MAG: hypothetical protein K1X78_12220 [Verrucomicrobiaceae bacterium]|nr:hypothetical protein [Verrucomicrobiaceae bacterium]